MANKHTLFFVLFLLYLLLLFFLLFSNDLGFRYTRYPYQDKLIHFGAFFLGQLLVLLTGKVKGVIRSFVYIVFLLLPVISEIVQEILPNRVQDYTDMLAGYLGILTCLGFWFGFKLIRKYFFLKER